MTRKKFLITGASGQLARAFIRALSQEKKDFFAPPESELDITRDAHVTEALVHYQPDVVINCAAYNLVDEAEKDPQAAFAVNARAVERLAGACQAKKIFLVHYSTDYVFDGQKYAPYTENDLTAPVNEYGKSKLKGEEAVQDVIRDYLLFRVSWVFGQGGKNFLAKLMTWANDRPVLEIAENEISVPTFTDDIVRFTLMSLHKDLRGLYHLPNGGLCSRLEWAKIFFTEMGFKNKIIPVKKEIFGLPARRPDFSAMSHQKIAGALTCPLPSWQEAVRRFCRQLKKET